MSANTKASATELYTSTEDPLMATSTISNKPGTSRPAQTTSAASPPPPCSGDYYDVDDECDRVTERTTQGQKPSELSRCDYKPCTHLQRTCIDSRPQHCFCPGMTPGNVPPDPPTFVTAADVRGHAVVVTWCAPYSAVQEYWLQLQQETEPFRKNQSLSPISRQCVFSGLKTSSRYKACVTARNSAGSSSTTCVGFQTEVGPELYIYSLAALSGSLLLTACILSVCLWKQRRSKQPAVESAHLTGLISIPNPAFSCSEERQTSPSKIFKI
ncbi:leucine-rich repeat neuronal protein 4-like [Denticeps clupeoides]|uniref:Fibronectin type-III domain-containing protein n=1 Tax=Denticeps clupeoides TaxID=299321 RepID=A0AAY4CDM7_9TELE|nr:leucine-rich repeat neuronal protein 4-like [Denticeps clupeoides]